MASRMAGATPAVLSLAKFTCGDSLSAIHSRSSPPPREPVAAESLAQRNGTGQCAVFRARACVQTRPMIHLKCGTSQKSVPDRLKRRFFRHTFGLGACVGVRNL